MSCSYRQSFIDDLYYVSGVRGDIDMGLLPKDRLLELREKVERQRNTVAALKRDGHEHADAERQLKQMLWDLRMSEDPHTEA